MTTPGPVWDGAGRDPWLPERLVAALDAAVAERSIYEAVWDALSSWLVATARRVLRWPVPEPEAIFAQAPAWERAVDTIIETAIVPVMSWAYEGIFGEGYEWRDRPNVISYLAGVKNRMVRTPDEVFDLVAGQIAAGVTLGEGIPELAERVDEVLSTTKTERWPNRAVVIARTETLGALNGSRTDAFQAFAEEDEGDAEYERMWLATIDHRTRKTHREADGQRTALTEPFMVGGFPLMSPLDPAGPPQETIQCRCTTLLLEKGESINLADRQMRR
jgi:hypothetical protein